jgi:8-oxo-dGTP pyrophosphatase MutT (NUDIX family)
MAFAAGMMVFPGGRVDPADADPRLVARTSIGPDEAAARLGGATEPELAIALHVAAIRELFEEAGVLVADGAAAADRAAAADGAAGTADATDRADLRIELLAGRVTFGDVAERLDLRLRADRLTPIARWVTPAAYPRRFDARFFAADLPSGAEATFVGDEVADHRWATPRAALDAMAAHEIEMWIPTSSTLQRLVDGRTVTAAGAVRPPSADRAGDVVRLTSWTAGGVPGQFVGTLVIGRSELVVVDPGDPSPEALASILAVASDAAARIVAIVITDPDPARAAGADELSERTGAQVHGPPGSAAWLPFPVLERPALPDDPLDMRAWVGLGDEPR